MTEVKVAVLGASGWMGKVHTMAYQTFPHFFGESGGTARVAALVGGRPLQDQVSLTAAPGLLLAQPIRSFVGQSPPSSHPAHTHHARREHLAVRAEQLEDRRDH